jgi:hypothetical protein
MLHQSIKRLMGQRAPTRRSPLDEGLGFTIRFAYPDDHDALCHLAALDSQPLLPGPLLVAEVGGDLWAAVSLADGHGAIADPFHHTAELVALLRERAAHLTRHPGSGRAPAPLLRVASQ